MHSIIRANLILLLSFMSPIAVAGELAFEGAPGGASAFGAIIGDHKCVMTYRGQDGELSEQANCRWHFYYKFEGHMVQDDFTMYDDAGNAVWNGSTLRTWDRTGDPRRQRRLADLGARRAARLIERWRRADARPPGCWFTYRTNGRRSQL